MVCKLRLVGQPAFEDPHPFCQVLREFALQMRLGGECTPEGWFCCLQPALPDSFCDPLQGFFPLTQVPEDPGDGQAEVHGMTPKTQSAR